MKTAFLQPDPARLRESISGALDFLCANQLASGEFRTFASSDLESHGTYESSPFVTSLVLYSLLFSHDPRAEKMTRKGLDMLASEMEGDALWRYWSSMDERHDLLPPDLDDTCCISFLLREYGRPFPSNRELILANRNSDGIFNTWLVPRSSSTPVLRAALRQMLDPGLIAITSLGRFPGHVDCAVNANVLLYLGSSADTQPAIDYVIRAALQRPPACSDYYIHWLSFYYFLSRAYWNGVTPLGQTRAALQERIIATQDEDGSCGDELLTALAVCTLLNFDIRIPFLDRSIEYLLRSQRDNGTWRRIPMFLGPAPYYGSEELTTGFCVEALTRYAEQLD